MPKSSASIKTLGFQGGSCRDATRDIERALGVAGTEQLLPDYFQRASTGEQFRQGNEHATGDAFSPRLGCSDEIPNLLPYFCRYASMSVWWPITFHWSPSLRKVVVARMFTGCGLPSMTFSPFS